MPLTDTSQVHTKKQENLYRQAALPVFSIQTHFCRLFLQRIKLSFTLIDSHALPVGLALARLAEMRMESIDAWDRVLIRPGPAALALYCLERSGTLRL